MDDRRTPGEGWDEQKPAGERWNEQRPAAKAGEPGRPTLNAAVRRRRADRAFYLRLAGAIRQQERALERLKQ